METPGALEVTRFPMVNVPVCVVKGVRATPCMNETPGVNETLCMEETPRVSGAACARETARVCEQPCGSEARCVRETPWVSAPACVNSMVCVKETSRVSERPCVRGTACVRSLCVREMTVGMREHAAVSPGVSVMVRCLSVVTRRSACVEWRRRRRQTRDKSRVVAVTAMGTVPGLHGGERAVRTVPGTRPPRARLRE